jgi:hypothetical protein
VRTLNQHISHVGHGAHGAAYSCSLHKSERALV